MTEREDNHEDSPRANGILGNILKEIDKEDDDSKISPNINSDINSDINISNLTDSRTISYSKDKKIINEDILQSYRESKNSITIRLIKLLFCITIILVATCIIINLRNYQLESGIYKEKDENEEKYVDEINNSCDTYILQITEEYYLYQDEYNHSYIVDLSIWNPIIKNNMTILTEIISCKNREKIENYIESASTLTYLGSVITGGHAYKCTYKSTELDENNQTLNNEYIFVSLTKLADSDETKYTIIDNSLYRITKDYICSKLNNKSDNISNNKLNDERRVEYVRQIDIFQNNRWKRCITMPI